MSKVKVKKVKRKHWSEYPKEKISYGSHKLGFGIYHVDGLDYWLDWECALPEEKIRYKKYLKLKGFTEKDGSL